MKKAIAMKCSQKDWDSIKDRIPKEMINDTKFDLIEYPYLTNNYFGKMVYGIGTHDDSMFRDYVEIHETFNAKAFLNACGIEFDEYKITKEQILKLHHHGHDLTKTQLNDLYPECFKKELIVGVWYKNGNGKTLFLYNGTDKRFGFNSKGEWCYYIGNAYDYSLIEATPQEVEAALICEWERLGGGNGISIKSTSGIIGLVSDGVYIFDKSFNKLYYGGYEIFDNGKFAQIIETITIQEAEKLLNKKIV